MDTRQTHHPKCDQNDHDGLCSETVDGLTNVFPLTATLTEGSGSGRYPSPGTTDWVDRGKPDNEPC